MKVLVVYAHPNPKSFNHAVLESFTKGLKDGGHTFEVVDLYAIKFDPSIKPEDFVQFIGGQMPQDVLSQQDKVSQADAMAFIGPIMGYLPPAILLGWLQRVFSFGFAWKASEKGWEGLLTHKKALSINTTGFTKEYWQASDADEAMKTILEDTCTAVGIQNFEQVLLPGVTAVDDQTRKGYLELAYRLGKGRFWMA